MLPMSKGTLCSDSKLGSRSNASSVSSSFAYSWDNKSTRIFVGGGQNSKLSLQNGQERWWSSERTRQFLQNTCPQGVVVALVNRVQQIGHSVGTFKLLRKASNE